MKKIFLLTALMAMMVLGAQAQEPARVPAYRGMIVRVQPDGDSLRTYLRGDEHKHWMMMDDGWVILQNKKGWYCYAKKNRKGEAVLTCRKAHNASKRSNCEKKWLEKKGVNKVKGEN
jgi:hypothetical protein